MNKLKLNNLWALTQLAVLCLVPSGNQSLNQTFTFTRIEHIKILFERYALDPSSRQSLTIQNSQLHWLTLFSYVNNLAQIRYEKF